MEAKMSMEQTVIIIDDYWHPCFTYLARPERPKPQRSKQQSRWAADIAAAFQGTTPYWMRRK